MNVETVGNMRLSLKLGPVSEGLDVKSLLRLRAKFILMLPLRYLAILFSDFLGSFIRIFSRNSI